MLTYTKNMFLHLEETKKKWTWKQKEEVTILPCNKDPNCWWWTLNQKNVPCSICKYRTKNYNTHFISIPIFVMNIIVHGVKKTNNMLQCWSINGIKT
jgi:hypothetical protein